MRLAETVRNVHFVIGERIAWRHVGFVVSPYASIILIHEILVRWIRRQVLAFGHWTPGGEVLVLILEKPESIRVCFRDSVDDAVRVVILRKRS